jgi:hypothetical protein
MTERLFVRPVDLKTGVHELTNLLQRNLPDFNHDARFAWRYLNEPGGQARAWFVCSGREDRVVGSASVFPLIP